MAVLAAAAHTKADYMAKAALQEATAHRVWFFLAGMIGICTVINWASKALAHVPSLRKRAVVSDIETVNTAQNKSSLTRLHSAVTATFKSVAFRYGIPTPFGSAILVSELGFIISYAAVNFTLLLIRSKFDECAMFDPADWSSVGQHLQLFWYEDRAAHLASVQLPLIVGLAGKNNVLSFLTGVSHEKVHIHLTPGLIRINFGSRSSISCTELQHECV
jgi:ferric-chelate reductase